MADTVTVCGGGGAVLALLRMTADEVPQSVRDRLDTVVAPVWAPAGTDLEDAPRVEAEVLVTAGEPTTVLERLPALRGIVLTTTATDAIDLEHCRKRGITVCNNPHYTGPAVAEHALALALAVNRQLVEQDRGARSNPPAPAPLTRDIAGRVAGIVGLGDIGARLAGLAQGLGMRVVFANRSPRDHPAAEQVGLPELLRRADFVFLTLPLTPQTRHLIDRAAIATMRPDAYLVNVSADELIDPAALAAALREERIAGAALDVIGDPQPFAGLPHLLLTTASAWYTREGVVRRAEGWLGTVEAFVAGHPRNVVLQGGTSHGSAGTDPRSAPPARPDLT